MVLRFIDDRYKSAFKWGIVSLVAFVIPDIYIFEGTRTLPKKVIVDPVPRDREHAGARRRHHRAQDPQGTRAAAALLEAVVSAPWSCLNCAP